MRQGLRSVLDNYADLEVIGEAGDGEMVICLADSLQPDVVVMDITMPRICFVASMSSILARHPAMISSSPSRMSGMLKK
jgi:DNA-binding NarL/FixJ family response regulator